MKQPIHIRRRPSTIWSGAALHIDHPRSHPSHQVRRQWTGPQRCEIDHRRTAYRASRGRLDLRCQDRWPTVSSLTRYTACKAQLTHSIPQLSGRRACSDGLDRAHTSPLTAQSSHAGTSSRSLSRASVTTSHPSCAFTNRPAPPQLVRPDRPRPRICTRSTSRPRPRCCVRASRSAPRASSHSARAATPLTRPTGVWTPAAVIAAAPDSCHRRCADGSSTGSTDRNLKASTSTGSKPGRNPPRGAVIVTTSALCQR